MLAERLDTVFLYRPQTVQGSQTELRGTVHQGVPGELNTFESFFSVGICSANGNGTVD